MVNWELRKDGWYYSEDGTKRWKKREDGSVAAESVPVGITMTDQQFIKDCDVNEILARILKTGQMPANFGVTGVYGDFSEIGDYQESLHVIMEADKKFMSLPVHIRQKFENDPQKLMDYLADPANIKESVDLGLRQRTDSPDPVLEHLAAINETLKVKTEVAEK